MFSPDTSSKRLQMKPPKAWTTAALVVAIAISLFLGAAIGFKAGDASAKIDFCADNTSGRYIQHEASRSTSCR
jgi:hypothetical protein